MEFVLFLFMGVMITGGIWMILKVSKDSTKAMLAWLFVPFYRIIYLSGHWNEMKKPFYIWLAGTVGIVIIAVRLS
ncbi:MAG: hypothetical protein Q8O55_13205 [Dehalococcoidales bacterium]|nr:hypothetical protein [Dehalococcoidales bacterium]